jgi:hypothetical protein
MAKTYISALPEESKALVEIDKEEDEYSLDMEDIVLEEKVDTDNSE